MAFGALAACNSSDDAPVETLAQVVTRVAAPVSDATPTPVDEPGTYRIEFDRYVAGQVGDETVGTGTAKRRALKASPFTRKITRPFDETGLVRRTLGFVQEHGSETHRVTFVRPLADDPRPRLYPPESAGTTRRLEIAGRECTATTVDEQEYCIDDAGLVLMQRGKASLEIATKVTVDATAKSATALAGALADGFTEKEKGSIRPIHPDSAPPGTDFSLDAAPEGFTLVGRYAVAPLTSEVLKGSRKIVAGIVDVYVRGNDALVVERGGKLDKSAVDDVDLGTLVGKHPADLGALGAGEVGIGGVAPFGYREVRAFPEQGRYVVVAGTLPEDELIALTQSLHKWPGTRITYLDPPKAPPTPEA
jgi:hypothetical protein